MAVLYNGLFTGESDTILMSSGDTTLETNPIHETYESFREMVLFSKFSDTGGQTPTMKIEISLFYRELEWSDWEEIDAAVAVPRQSVITTYDQSWWKKCKGVKFRYTKAGAGDVTIIARWL